MKVGDRLSNGSMLLAWKKERDSQVILALNQKNEFVVWALDSNGTPFSGQYYQELLDAVEMFKNRV